jgi:hypothetical protein
MSNRYKGGIISATPPTTTGGESGTASGAWTLEQQLQAQAAGLWPIQPPPLYIEDVFSTWLYTGNGATQTITNGINLSGKGGLVWIKSRSAAYFHSLTDTARGAANAIYTNSTLAQNGDGNSAVNPFLSSGFTLNSANITENQSGQTYVSWTFREQPKFFDVVTYTGNGVAGRQIAHNLGSEPGFIAVKKTSSTGDWLVYHRSRPAKYLYLNSTAAEGDDSGGVVWGNGSTAVAPTSTNFTVNALTGFPSADINASGETYVAYLFAHNAGGFGLSGEDNVISCGSFTGNGSTSGPEINLGYEPQWIMIKNASAATNWRMFDNMRGMPVSGSGNSLEANTSAAEAANDPAPIPTATGFRLATTNSNLNGNGNTMIYIAIRRGPMKVPTDGASVFAPLARNTNGTNTQITTTLSTVDMVMYGDRNGVFGQNSTVIDRLRGYTKLLRTSGTSSENTDSSAMTGFDVQKGYGLGTDTSGFGTNYSVGGPYPVVNWQFGRAPGFFDEVCYTGDSVTGRSINHNLDVAPEIIIVKRRSGVSGWSVYSAPTGNSSFLQLESVASVESSGLWANTTPTSDVFYVTDSSGKVNSSGQTYVAYLFASCPGVSKCGSYTGTGTTQTINCGFTAGSRFVLIKRTDASGDWYVWDSARGIVAGNDPYLLLNSTAAEVTNTDYVDTAATGFEISSTAPAAINASGGTFIFLAIA